MNWPFVPLGEVATLQRGFDLPAKIRTRGIYPVFAANGPHGHHCEAKVLGPGVVTGRSGTIGKVHYVDSDYWPLNTALFVKDFHGNHPKWVYYLLRHFHLERFSQGAGVPTLNRNLVHGELVPLPPLPEQKRIAAILDAADALRTQRRQSIAELDFLLQSTFLEMFGDPVENPKGWEVVNSTDLLEIKPRIGTTKPANGNGYLVVRVGELGEMRIAFNKCGRVEANEKEVEKFKLKNGDTIIARAIGSKAQLGKSSYFYGYKEIVIIDSHVMRLRPDSNKCHSLWFFSLISSERGKSLLQKAGGETAVQFNINTTQASSIKIPLPPFELQENLGSLGIPVVRHNM